MLNPVVYHDVYNIVLLFITLLLVQQYSSYRTSRLQSAQRQPAVISLLLLLFMVLFIGTRPLSSRAFVDMVNYNQTYNMVAENESVFTFSDDYYDILFTNLFNWMAISGYDSKFFFLVIAVIYFTFMWQACRKWFPNDTLYAFVVYLSAFSTFSYGTNGIRAGAAASVFMLALAYRHDKLWLSVVLALMSWGIHHSMHVVLVAYFVVILVKNPIYYFGIWCICILCAAIHLNPLSSLMLSITDERSVGYLTAIGEWSGVQGFRLDFLVYSAVPIAIGYYIVFILRIRNVVYDTMLSLYLLLNSMWALCMYIPFNNRVAYLSWFLLPIVSIYPMLKLDMRPLQLQQYKLLNRVAGLYMAFLLFMRFVYE